VYCNGQKKYGFEVILSLLKHYECCNDVLHHGRVKVCSLGLLNPHPRLNMLFSIILATFICNTKDAH
jgi:hypothetical protein